MGRQPLEVEAEGLARQQVDGNGVGGEGVQGDDPVAAGRARTLHGVERMGVAGPPAPLSYYSRPGPVGQVFAALPDPAIAARTAVVGLGTGAMACYSRPGQRWTFYEIDPAIVRIARNPRLFTYLRDCPGRFDVVVGDARRSLATDAVAWGPEGA